MDLAWNSDSRQRHEGATPPQMYLFGRPNLGINVDRQELVALWHRYVRDGKALIWPGWRRKITREIPSILPLRSLECQSSPNITIFKDTDNMRASSITAVIALAAGHVAAQTASKYILQSMMNTLR
jgi:hypothetical protein